MATLLLIVFLVGFKDKMLVVEKEPEATGAEPKG
jgi:hypothetical protein